MRRFLIILIVGLFLVSGCKEELKDGSIINVNQYHFFSSLNITCSMHFELVGEIGNLDWVRENSSKIFGKTCEAISPDCTAEYIAFKSDNNSLRHRVHYMGSPDDSYYLSYKGEKYSCKAPTIESVYVREKNYARFELPEGENECTSDSECFVGGCSGETCTSHQPKITTCELPKGMVSGLSCGCINTRCIWRIK